MRLAEIRDSRRSTECDYSSFDDYVRDRWGMSTRHAHRLVDGAQIAKNLLPPPRVLIEGEATEAVSIKQLLHLSIALTHLKNFRGSLDQDADPRRKAAEFAARGKSKARNKAALKAATAAKLVKLKQQVSKMDVLHVLCRTNQSGAKTISPGYRVDGIASPGKAQTFASLEAAKRASHHEWDKPMMLHRARGLRA